MGRRNKCKRGSERFVPHGIQERSACFDVGGERTLKTQGHTARAGGCEKILLLPRGRFDITTKRLIVHHR